jgi:hypothetical protein
VVPSNGGNQQIERNHSSRQESSNPVSNDNGRAHQQQSGADTNERHSEQHSERHEGQRGR